ncbi:MAG: hypothetical protein JNM63_19325 [Spirochaetia bacterium]|nr:hypothetical protein [Spirochaetia bacterium]
MKINVALILLGLLLFNHPFLGIFETKYHFLFVPVLIVAIFVIWAIYIFFLYLSTRREGR